MRIWEVKDLGLDNLTLTEKDIKSIADDEILVEMKAATLNYRDLIMIEGGYGPIGGKPPFIPISDGSVIVKEVGKRIKNFKVSDVVIPPFFKGWDSGLENFMAFLRFSTASCLGDGPSYPRI